MDVRKNLEMEISKFQLIRINRNRIVIRYYNEEKDDFQKICAAKTVNLVSDRLLITDEKVFLDHEGKAVYLGKQSETPVVWNLPSGGRLLVFDTTYKPLGYKALFVQTDGDDFTEAVSYDLQPDRVTIATPDNRKVVYELQADGSVVKEFV